LRLTADALGLLRTFALSAAVVAVRREAPPVIAQGLAALAILGEVDDPRDLTFYLAALHYSALRLGIDTRELFEQAASLSPSTFFGGQMRGFPALPPASRDLGGYRLRERSLPRGSTSCRIRGEANDAAQSA
jgi:hypothetical protein